MHILDARKNPVELELVTDHPAMTAPTAAPDPFEEASPVVRAGRAFFDLGRGPAKPKQGAVPDGPPPAVFRETRSGLVRTVYREVMIRFRRGTPQERRSRILAKHGFEVRKVSPFVRDQVVVADAARRCYGADLLEVANDLAEMDEVVFAAPNFVSEFRRMAAIRIPAAQWHLDNRGAAIGQLKGEDVDARAAWAVTRGKRAIVIAVLDDGVDVDHPNLRSRIWKNPSASGKDRIGRDFFLPDDHPDHYNPRPKKFRYPYDQMPGNDVHGTCCAGVAAAAGTGAYGVAPGCRILAVKIFHADDLAPDERVADAVRYAASRADVLSCSWSGPQSPDLELALEDAGRLGRKGRGSAIFCAAGNEDHAPVGFPASAPATIAVGASTDQATLAWYSNVGPELDVVAPSNGGVRSIFTTDVGYAGRGFNIGRADRGGKDGLHCNDFGGTSSATPLAAGVAALVLSKNPKLDREAVREILRKSADKIGGGYDANGRSDEFGYGRVNAAKALDLAG